MTGKWLFRMAAYTLLAVIGVAFVQTSSCRASDHLFFERVAGRMDMWVILDLLAGRHPYVKTGWLTRSLCTNS
jgi:hypothetical protein